MNCVKDDLHLRQTWWVNHKWAAHRAPLCSGLARSIGLPGARRLAQRFLLNFGATTAELRGLVGVLSKNEGLAALQKQRWTMCTVE